MEVEVAFASSNEQVCISIKVEDSVTVNEAIVKSGITDQFTEIDLVKMKVGIFGKICNLDTILEEGDRVEIYRFLLHNPMDARRNRALKI
ncbi:MAG: RnfH family protein [Methylococcales bacterium]|nr:RnfH family protein [Methylococcales bacterium]